jgi:hypothetical protein
LSEVFGVEGASPRGVAPAGDADSDLGHGGLFVLRVAGADGRGNFNHQVGETPRGCRAAWKFLALCGRSFFVLENGRDRRICVL